MWNSSSDQVTLIGAQVPFPTADVCNLLGLSESSFALLEFFQDLLALLLGDSRLLQIRDPPAHSFPLEFGTCAAAPRTAQTPRGS